MSVGQQFPIGKLNLIRYAVLCATHQAIDSGCSFSWVRRKSVWPFYSVRR
jgi:hypothetical protein